MPIKWIVCGGNGCVEKKHRTFCRVARFFGDGAWGIDTNAGQAPRGYFCVR